jgi:hypothetical protein
MRPLLTALLGLSLLAGCGTHSTPSLQPQLKQAGRLQAKVKLPCHEPGCPYYGSRNCPNHSEIPW